MATPTSSQTGSGDGVHFVLSVAVSHVVTYLVAGLIASRGVGLPGHLRAARHSGLLRSLRVSGRGVVRRVAGSTGGLVRAGAAAVAWSSGGDALGLVVALVGVRHDRHHRHARGRPRFAGGRHLQQASLVVPCDRTAGSHAADLGIQLPGASHAACGGASVAAACAHPAERGCGRVHLVHRLHGCLVGIRVLGGGGYGVRVGPSRAGPVRKHPWC